MIEEELEMKAADAEARLRLLLGLNKYEARVYITLLRKGPKKAVDLSSISGVPRGRVYDVLRSLEAKGLVNRQGHEYSAVHPRRALSRLGQRVLIEALETIRKLEELAEELEEEYSENVVEEEIRLIHGLRESLAAALSAVTNCSETIYFTSFKSAEKIVELWSLLSPLVERLSPKARVLIPPNINVPLEIIKTVTDRGVEVRRHPTAMIDSMVACDTVIIGLPSSSYEVISVYVRHKDFSRSLWRRLDEFWREAEPIR